MPSELAPQVRSLLHRLAGRIPPGMDPADQRRAADRVVAGLEPGEVQALRSCFEDWLVAMDRLDASDIDLGGPGCSGRVWYRVAGDKDSYGPEPSLSQAETDVWILSLLAESRRERLLELGNLDFSYEVHRDGMEQRFRGDAYVDLGHLALNMRAIRRQVLPLKEFKFHPNITRNFSVGQVRKGLILITGITGSGKSTTLDSIIGANNHAVPAQIIIIGSPIEHIHRSQRCIIRHREVGLDVTSFKEGAIQAMRQDPDIIVIGEMRDADTIMTALEVTDTGHKVLSTLHTSSAVESLDRIIAECPSIDQERIRNRLADVLNVVVSQKLIPALHGGRVLAKEVLLVTASVRAAIRNGNTGEIYQMVAEGGDQGMVTMEQDLLRLFRNRRIAPSQAMSFANDKRRMQELMSVAA